ncbi:MAG: hypothetical protein K2I34_00285 [Paramuribaculum sp.]|nr:hypothetical protein [Paramuribaculum sp.]
MTRPEQRLTDFLRSRGFAWLLTVVATTAACISFIRPMPATPSDMGLWLPSPGLWLTDPAASFVCALAGSLATGLVMVAVNRVFNLLRTVSVLFAGLFMLLQSATPTELTRFSGAPLLALTMLLSMTALYASYQSPSNTRRVFLVFMLVTVGTMFQYGFLPFLIVAFIGCNQMRLLNFKCLLAALTGIAAPLWCCMATGIIDPMAMRLPPVPDPHLFFSLPVAPKLTVATAVSLTAGLVCGTLNLMKVISMNARTRAMHGFLAATGIASGLLCIMDFNNVVFYAGLLNACTAFQVAFTVRLYGHRRAYIAVLALTAACLSCILWTLTT